MSLINIPRNITKLRENEETSRAGLKWEKEEDEELMKKVLDKVDIEDIAKLQKRTIGSIKSRILMHALEMTKTQSIDEVSILVSIPVESINEYKQRIEKKTKKKESKHDHHNDNDNDDEKYICILIEIRDLLKTIVQKQNSSII